MPPKSVSKGLYACVTVTVISGVCNILDVWLIAAVLQCLLTHARFSLEKGDGEYQHSPGSGDEEWEIQPGLPLHAQVPATGEGKAHHPRQQRSPSEVSWALFRICPLFCCITYCVLLLCETANESFLYKIFMNAKNLESSCATVDLDIVRCVCE